MEIKQSWLKSLALASVYYNSDETGFLSLMLFQTCLFVWRANKRLTPGETFHTLIHSSLWLQIENQHCGVLFTFSTVKTYVASCPEQTYILLRSLSYTLKMLKQM